MTFSDSGTRRVSRFAFHEESESKDCKGREANVRLDRQFKLTQPPLAVVRGSDSSRGELVHRAVGDLSFFERYPIFVGFTERFDFYFLWLRGHKTGHQASDSARLNSGDNRCTSFHQRDCIERLVDN
jgi:hypothetical protein